MHSTHPFNLPLDLRALWGSRVRFQQIALHSQYTSVFKKKVKKPLTYYNLKKWHLESRVYTDSGHYIGIEITIFVQVF